MRKYFFIFCLSLIFSMNAYANVSVNHTYTVPVFFEYDFEDADACLNHFNTVAASPNCAYSAVSCAGTYGLMTDQASEYVRKNLTNNTYTEVWIEQKLRFLSAFSGSTSTARNFVQVRQGVSTGDSENCHFQIYYSTSYKFAIYNYALTARTISSEVASGNTCYYMRMHLKIDNSAGVIQMAYSTDGINYTTSHNLTGIDTLVSGYNAYISAICFGTILSDTEDPLIDDIKIYTVNPGWIF